MSRYNDGKDYFIFSSTVRSFCRFPNGILFLIFFLVATFMKYIQKFIFFKIFTICMHNFFFYHSCRSSLLLFQSLSFFSSVTLCKCPCFSPLTLPPIFSSIMVYMSSQFFLNVFFLQIGRASCRERVLMSV